MRSLVIVNRCAKRLREEGPLLDALRKPRAESVVVETRSLEELDRALARVTGENPETVVLAGGDGTYMAGVTRLVRLGAASSDGEGKGGMLDRRALPNIALAPGGTVCTVARNWGMRGDLVSYADRLCAAAARGEVTTIHRPTLAVRGRDVDDVDRERRIGFIFGAGLVARFFEVYEAEGSAGYVGAGAIVARVFVGSFVGGELARRILTPVRCAIEVDGENAPFERASLVAASVVRDLGLSMRVLYRAAERSDRIHVVATPLGPLRLGPQLPLVLAGRCLRGPRIDRLAGELTLRFPPREGAYVLDGELTRADTVTVTPGPVLRIVTI